jgi:hypothetical protein
MFVGHYDKYVFSSEIIWESMHKRYYKAVKATENTALEEAYVAYMQHREAGGTHELCTVKLPNATVMKVCAVEMCVEPTLLFQVDFERMRIPGEKAKHKFIRRSYRVGFWVSYATSMHTTRLHLKLNHLQVSACTS